MINENDYKKLLPKLHPVLCEVGHNMVRDYIRENVLKGAIVTQDGKAFLSADKMEAIQKYEKTPFMGFSLREQGAIGHKVAKYFAPVFALIVDQQLANIRISRLVSIIKEFIGSTPEKEEKFRELSDRIEKEIGLWEEITVGD